MNNNDAATTKLNFETAQIRWHELLRFFAAGNAIAVNEPLDLLEVAGVIARDEAAQLKIWMDEGRVDAVTDQQARLWHEEDAIVWAVVVKPWVLVQPVLHSEQVG